MDISTNPTKRIGETAEKAPTIDLKNKIQTSCTTS
jgi:hypothetical protein